MTRNRLMAWAAGALLLIGVIALFISRRVGDQSDAEDATPTASITTALVRRQELQEVVSAYGVVEADRAGSITIAAPRTVIVNRVLVRAGQSVVAGQPLLELASAPAAVLAYRQAEDAEAFARTDLARVQRLFDAHLASSDQLTAANKALSDANAALAAQRAQGGDRPAQSVTAPSAGVIVSLAVAPGDHVAQDAPLLQLARAGALSVKLDLDPSTQGVAAGQPATIQPVAGGPPFTSRLTLVGHAADPATRMIEAFAPLGGVALPLGAAVKADVVTGERLGLVAPRAAVVFDETGTHLFTISGGKAHRVFVTAGRSHGDVLELTGPLSPGAVVAVQGAYELQDGMAVKVAGR